MHDASTPSIVSSLVAAFRPELAFPFLTEDMLERARGYGHEENVEADVTLWSRGERDVDLFIVLKGMVEVYDQIGDRRQAIAVFREGQFSGELDLLSSRQTLVDGCTVTACILLRIERSSLQRMMRAEGDIANLIMQATIWRRLGILQRAEAGIVLVGSGIASDTIHLQRFLTRNNYPHRLLEPTAEQYASSEPGSQETAAGTYLLPAIVFPDGRILHRPSVANLADELGMTEILDPHITYDLTVIGAGPSGLAAAVYGASEGLSTLVIEGIAPGGQAGTSSKIENYLGFPTGVSGQELANRAQVQAQKFGARLAVSREAVCVDQIDGVHKITIVGGTKVCSRAVVIATGAQYRKLQVPNFERFENQGIHYAATAMEAQLCREQEVAVIGGGNSAGQAAIFLSGIARHVHLIIRGGSLVDSMSQYLISRIEHSTHITLHADTDVEHLDGDTALRCATWANRKTGERTTRQIAAMFAMIGAEPNTGWLYGTLALDKKGFIVTGTERAFENTRYATSVPGIFAVGDVRSDSVKRVASAVGEGSVVISDVHRYLAGHPAVDPEAHSTLAAMQAVAPPAL